MMSKQKPNVRNEFQKRHLDTHKHGKFGPMWKWCWLGVCVCVCVCFRRGGGGDCQGVIHHEFLPRGQTVKKEYYLTVTKVPREAVRRKKAWFVEGKKWFLHHYKDPANSSVLIRDFFTKHETTLVPQPPY